jgi:hypothetical protein
MRESSSGAYNTYSFCVSVYSGSYSPSRLPITDKAPERCEFRIDEQPDKTLVVNVIFAGVKDA